MDEEELKKRLIDYTHVGSRPRLDKDLEILEEFFNVAR